MEYKYLCYIDKYLGYFKENIILNWKIVGRLLEIIGDYTKNWMEYKYLCYIDKYLGYFKEISL